MNSSTNLKFITIAVALCVLAFLGGQYLTKKSINKPIPATSSTTDTPTPPETPKTASLTESSPATDTNKGYIDIKEWNVRFKEGDLTQDAVYLVKDDHTLFFSTKTYISKASDGSCKADGSTGYLVRGKAGYDYNGSGNKIENLSYDYKDTGGKSVTISSKKISDYYYFWVAPQAPCADPDKLSYDQQSVYQKALSDLSSTVQELSPGSASNSVDGTTN